MESKHYLRKSRNSRKYLQLKSIRKKPFLFKAEIHVGKAYLESQCNFSLWNLNSLIQDSCEYIPDETLLGVKNLLFK